MSFPIDVLRDGDRAICFFVAAFGGANDLRFITAAGIKQPWCIDNNAEKVEAMRATYPDAFFTIADGFAVIDNEVNNPPQPRTEIVTVDPWSGPMEARCVECLPKLLSLTRRVLVFGACAPDAVEAKLAEIGFAGTVRRVLRNPANNAHWVVVEKTS